MQINSATMLLFARWGRSTPCGGAIEQQEEHLPITKSMSQVPEHLPLRNYSYSRGRLKQRPVKMT